ncbi:MAG: hypothetical protein OXG15_14635 [Gammaproteobacteria bacterium]|nr:hypothetical protein [Gammaproteobacteria bacterium]
MSNSVSSQLLLDALAHCARERFSKDALARLCDALETGLKSNDDPRIELFEALTNYAYQLRDGAIQATVDTTSLFHEAQTLLGEESSSRQSTSFDDQVANLLERIDLAASGGFDALEAGEVPEFDRLVESTSESLRIQNTLHRINASLNAIERHAQSSRSASPSLAAIYSRHRRLVNALAPPPLSDQVIPLTALEEMLSLQLTDTNADLNVDREGLVHPTYIPILSSLISHLAHSLSANKIRDIQISHRQDVIVIQLTLLVRYSSESDLRANAIEQGFLSADAPLHDGDELQYLLLPKTSQSNEQLIQSSALFDALQSLCAKIVVESMGATISVSTTLPANVKLEEVTTFTLNGAPYAILTESVKNIDYTVRAHDLESQSSQNIEHGSYRVIRLDQSNGKEEVCLQIDDGRNRIALFIDRIEPPGQLSVLDASVTSTHIGGSVRLLDRRLVVLISPDELDDPLSSILEPPSSASPLLLVLGTATFVSQLSPHDYQVSYAEGELDATAAFQEQRPKAIVVDQRELAKYDRLLTTATAMSVPVIVRDSGNQDVKSDRSFSEFNTVKSLTELEAQLQGFATEKGDEQQ